MARRGQPDAGGSDVFDGTDKPIGTPKPPRRTSPPPPTPTPPTDEGLPADEPAPEADEAGEPATSEADEPPPPPPAKRVAVPDKVAQAGALKLVKEVYAEEYRKKSAEDRLALAGQLLEQARGSGNDAATQYVMLREARDIAAAGGDVAVALAAVDAIAEAFNGVDAVALKLEALATAAKKVTEAAQAEAVVDGHLAVAADLLALGDLDRAVKTIAQAEPVARKAKDADLTARLAERKKALKELVTQYGAALPAAKAALAKSPANPAANATMGRFFCLAAGDWGQGLPMLALGNDALRKLAIADLTGAGQPPGEVAAGLGDAWWDFAEKQTGIAKSRSRGRAAHWYQQALDELEGLARTRVEKRLAQVAPDDVGGASGEGASADKSLRLLNKVLSVLPANARPKKGQPWDSAAVNRWLRGKVRSTPFDAVLRVSSVNATRSNGRDAISAFFEPMGPVELDGVDYRMTLSLYERGDVPAELVSKFKRGTHVRVRGVVSSLQANGFGGNGVDIKNVDFWLQLDRPTLTIVDKPPAAAAAAAIKAGPDSGKRLLDTLAKKMPAEFRPVPEADTPHTEGSQGWLDQYRGVPIEVVAKLDPVMDGETRQPRRDMVSFRMGPVRGADIDYSMSVNLGADGDEQRLAEFRKLTPGSWVRFRGVVRQIWQSSWNMNAGRFTSIHFGVEFEDEYELTPVPAPRVAQP